MKLITGIMLVCLCCVQSQDFSALNPYIPQFRSADADRIYFPQDEQIQPNKEIVQQIFGTPSRGNVGVEVERSNEISSTTTVEHVPGSSSGNAQSSAGRPSVPQLGVSQPGYNSLLYSVTNFGINLLKNINAAQSGNIVASPYSITSLLALLQQGTSGRTQEQISATLQMDPTASASAYSQISTNYKNRNTRNILRTANNVFVGDTFVIDRDFKRVAQRSFDSDITPVSFGNSEKAAGQINNWVSLKTNDKISRLFAPDAFDSTAQLVLVNAVYFKGLWEVPFKPEVTQPRQFHYSNGQTKRIPSMRTRRMLQSGTDSTTNARVVLLPFERNEYSLMVILPSALEGIPRTLRSLTDARLLSYLSFTHTEIELDLPKFTVRADTDLVPVLRNMGLARLFSPYAELDGLGTYRAFTPQISSAIHSAVLSIDEQGGSAAAATSFAAVALSYEDPMISFKVNRPFITVLWDVTTSLPLFMAVIEDPKI